MIHQQLLSQHRIGMFIIIFLIPIMLTRDLFAQSNMIDMQVTASNELVIAVDSVIHEDYGLGYPMTYIVRYSSGSEPLTASYRYSLSEEWNELPEKTSSEYFNGIEVVRFDEPNSTAYISVEFSEVGDSIYIRLTTDSDVTVDLTNPEIARYYDNRTAVVTATADDWHQWFDASFNQTLSNFRKYELPVTVGIVTDETTNYWNDPWMTDVTWASVQNQLDSGFVEIGSHSRNHLHVEYPDVEYEVQGSKDDLINKLDLPDQYRKGDKEYVYVWIAPYGEYSSKIDSMVGESQYLVSRLYQTGQTGISNWNSEEQKFDEMFLTVEIGAPPWGGGETDTTVLKDLFDNAYAEGGVYHIMCHPNVIKNDWGNKTYLDDHLSYISKRNDVWYVSLGHLYLYQMLYENTGPVTNVNEPLVSQIPTGFTLNQNYPNPFNPTTTISYEIQNTGFVQLLIYDQVGRLVRKLVDKNQSVGKHYIVWDGFTGNGKPASSGIYFYTLKYGDVILASKRMVLLK